MCHSGSVTEMTLRETKRRDTARALAQAAFDLARSVVSALVTVAGRAAWGERNVARRPIPNRLVQLSDGGEEA